MDDEETQEHPEQEVHPAVQLLLARMDSHPEEFKSGGKWNHLYEPFKSHWNATEKKLVKAKVREIQMGVLHEGVMNTLFGESDDGVACGSIAHPLHPNYAGGSSTHSTYTSQLNVARSTLRITPVHTFPTDPILQKPGLLGTLKGLIK